MFFKIKLHTLHRGTGGEKTKKYRKKIHLDKIQKMDEHRLKK